jgi:hypothetical protein
MEGRGGKCRMLRLRVPLKKPTLNFVCRQMLSFTLSLLIMHLTFIRKWKLPPARAELSGLAGDVIAQAIEGGSRLIVSHWNLLSIKCSNDTHDRFEFDFVDFRLIIHYSLSRGPISFWHLISITLTLETGWQFFSSIHFFSGSNHHLEAFRYDLNKDWISINVWFHSVHHQKLFWDMNILFSFSMKSRHFVWLNNWIQSVNVLCNSFHSVTTKVFSFMWL